MSPADRFATAEDLRRALEQVLHASYAPVETAAIGHALAHHFREDRERIRGEIEAQIKLVASDPWREPVTSSMPVLALEDSKDSDIADAPSNGAFVQGSVRPSDPRGAGTAKGEATSGRVAARWARAPRLIAAGVAIAVCVTGALVALGRPGTPTERGTGAGVAPPREALLPVAPPPAPPGEAILATAPPSPGVAVAAPSRVDPARPVQPIELAPPEPSPRVRPSSPSSPPRRVTNASTRRALAPAVPSNRPPAGDDDAPEIRPMKPKLSVDEQDPYAK